MNKIVPVLMYHAIDTEHNPCGSSDPGELVYVVNKYKFKEQMKYLQDAGYQTVTSLDILSGNPLPNKPIIIGFDDGHVSNYTLAMPILKEYNFIAEIYVTTDRVGTPNHLSEEQVLALHQEGMVIGSHGTSHRFLSDLSRKEMIDELSISRNVLESIIGKSIEIFAAPGGRYNNITVGCLKQLNYKVGYTSEIGYYNNRTNIFKIPRFAITRNMNLGEFNKIIQRDQIYLFKKYLVTKSLRITKKLLGNKLYQLVRGRLFK